MQWQARAGAGSVRVVEAGTGREGGCATVPMVHKVLPETSILPDLLARERTMAQFRTAAHADTIASRDHQARGDRLGQRSPGLRVGCRAPLVADGWSWAGGSVCPS